MKIGENDELVAKAKSLIRSNSKTAFGHDLFWSIEQDTLIVLLNFEWLSVQEAKTLVSCLSWAEENVKKLGLAQTD